MRKLILKITIFFTGLGALYLAFEIIRTIILNLDDVLLFINIIIMMVLIFLRSRHIDVLAKKELFTRAEYKKEIKVVLSCFLSIPSIAIYYIEHSNGFISESMVFFFALLPINFLLIRGFLKTTNRIIIANGELI